MKRLNLRYHHLMCCYTFAGIGYDEAFTRNMKRIVPLLEESDVLEIHLQDCCDDLCAHCPHQQGGRCDTEDSVAARDREVAAFFGLENRKTLSLADYREIVLKAQKRLHSISEVCRECTFTDLCNRVLSGKN